MHIPYYARGVPQCGGPFSANVFENIRSNLALCAKLRCKLRGDVFSLPFRSGRGRGLARAGLAVVAFGHMIGGLNERNQDNR